MKSFKEYNTKNNLNEVALSTVIGLSLAGAAGGYLQGKYNLLGKAHSALKRSGTYAKLGKAGKAIALSPITVPSYIAGKALETISRHGSGHYSRRDYDRGRSAAEKEADREAKKERKRKHQEKVDAAHATIKSHAAGLGFDPSNATSMTGYHEFMRKHKAGDPTVGVHTSGLATDTATAARGHTFGPHRGASGSRSNVQTPEDHDKAKQAHDFLASHGLI